MPNRDPFVGRAVCASLLAGLLAAGASGAASAVDDCLPQADRQADPGTYWVYRIDRVNHRRCWSMRQLRTRAPSSRAVERATPSGADSQPQLPSWLSSAIAAIRGESAPTQAPPRQRSDIARRSDPAKTLPQRPPQQSSAQPPAESGTPARASSLDQASRDALYQEFLQWQARQLFAPE